MTTNRQQSIVPSGLSPVSDAASPQRSPRWNPMASGSSFHTYALLNQEVPPIRCWFLLASSLLLYFNEHINRGEPPPTSFHGKEPWLTIMDHGRPSFIVHRYHPPGWRAACSASPRSSAEIAWTHRSPELCTWTEGDSELVDFHMGNEYIYVNIITYIHIMYKHVYI